MSQYLSWSKKTISDFSDPNINSLYNEGFLFTRTGRGEMYQTRSIRIDLNRFKLTSENRRVLRKISDCKLQIAELPMTNYHWSIGKLAKDFYTTKFGEGTFSANKVKELLTTQHNFNKLLAYNGQHPPTPLKGETAGERAIGYCICFENKNILHYSYPFYQLPDFRLQTSTNDNPKSEVRSPIANIGLGMMLQAILYAQKNNKRYVYLGSAKDAKAKYKLQFEGLEWFDGKIWQTNIEELKNVLK